MPCARVSRASCRQFGDLLRLSLVFGSMRRAGGYSGYWTLAPRSFLTCLLRPSWRPLRASWGPLGGPGGFLDRLGCLGGASWGLLGASWGHLGGLLEASWGLLGASWGHLGGHRSKKRVDPFRVPLSGPSSGPLGGLLGASWGPPGGLLGPPGRFLGPSWRPSIKKEGGFF